MVGGADLEDLARRHSIQWSCDAATGRHVIHAGRATLVFAPGLQVALVNNVVVTLSQPVSVEGGRVKLPPELARHVEAAPPPGPVVIPRLTNKEPLVLPVPKPPPVLPVTIAIDPGHGGLHIGGRGRTLLEKDVNLRVSLELQKILESWGARVVMTRTQDVHFDDDIDDDLEKRIRIVNGARPDLFISVHANYVNNAVARGFEVWVPLGEDWRSRESRDLAQLILGELEGVWNSDNRGIKAQHNLRVLKGTNCPAVLVELEFVSNPQAERQLGNAAVQKRLAEAIAEAARKWVLKR
jgi:N-acetylmuramoyl-L-alanine amidase